MIKRVLLGCILCVVTKASFAGSINAEDWGCGGNGLKVWGLSWQEPWVYPDIYLEYRSVFGGDWQFYGGLLEHNDCISSPYYDQMWRIVACDGGFCQAASLYAYTPTAPCDPPGGR
ncbi:MAG: hypothetical protein AAF438_07045 [Pseudomonadota bacterium]